MICRFSLRQPRGRCHIRVATLVAMLLACSRPIAVLTQHNDSFRTGANLRERILTPNAVDPLTGRGMALAFWRPVDGNMTAQVLYVPRVPVGGKRHNVIYAVTYNNSVYAYNADDESSPGTTAGLLWHTHLPVTPDSQLTQSWGIPGTPVIDRSTRTIYVVYGLHNGQFPWNGEGDGSFEAAYHLAALDIRTGAVLRDVRIAGSVPSAAPPGYAAFVARRQWQRAGLLLTSDPLDSKTKYIHVAFASRWREETHNWHGWVLRYEAATFAPRGVFCTTPERRVSNEGGGIWQGGAGLAADKAGNIYFTTGNGPGGPNSYGNSIVKLTPYRDPSGAYRFHVAGFSAALDDPAHAAEWANNDIDLGAGGVVVVPRSSRVIGGGKTGVLYVMDMSPGLSKLQSFDAFTNTYDPPNRYLGWIGGPHLHGSPTYWEVSKDSGFVYHWGEQDSLRRWPFDRGTGLLGLAHPLSGQVRALQWLMPGGMISLSANHGRDGVLWIILPELADTGRLLAMDARSLRTLWETGIPGVAHFVPPTVAQGKVYVPTGAAQQILVYKLAVPHLRPPKYVYRRPPYRIPPGDPLPRVRAALARLGSGAARLEPPTAVVLRFSAVASGFLVYHATPVVDDSTKLTWAPSLADAVLLDDQGLAPNMGFSGRGDTIAVIEGATWRARDGSSLVAEVIETVEARKGDGPGLLLRARSHGPPGQLTGVRYIQLLDMEGGAPPAAAAQGPRAGEEVRVGFRAGVALYDQSQEGE